MKRRKLLLAALGSLIFVCCGLLALVAVFGESEREETAATAVAGAGIETAVVESASQKTTPLPTATASLPAEEQPTLPPSPTLPPATVANTPTTAAVSAALPSSASENTAVPEGDQATVTRIIDGDTIEVEIAGSSYRLRYIGMDTPERGAPYFNEAAEANRKLVAGQTVILVKDVSETDRYGRLLRYVYLPDGTFVNAELVRQGYAQVATFPPDVRHQELFVQLQQEAQAAEVGLWAPDTVAMQPTHTPQPAPPQPSATAVPTQPLPEATATPQPPAPTAPPPIAPPAPASANVQITSIFYDGAVVQVESDEYAVITNNGGSAVNLAGWQLNAGDSGQDFNFPSFDLQPGQSCRVYTNEHHPESCGFSFGWGRAIWNNNGECGYLYDAGGNEVSRYCY